MLTIVKNECVYVLFMYYLFIDAYVVLTLGTFK